MSTGQGTLNYTTKIPAKVTVAEVQDLLARAGADAVSIRYRRSADGPAVPDGVGFRLETPHGPRTFAMPVHIDAMHKVLEQQSAAGLLKKSPAPRGGWATYERAIDVAWRVIKDWLKAQLAIIEAHMAQLDEIMLPYLEVGENETLYQRYRDREQTALEGVMNSQEARNTLDQHYERFERWADLAFDGHRRAMAATVLIEADVSDDERRIHRLLPVLAGALSALALRITELEGQETVLGEEVEGQGDPSRVLLSRIWQALGIGADADITVEQTVKIIEGYAHHTLRAGDHTEIRLHLPGGARLKFPAEVVKALGVDDGRLVVEATDERLALRDGDTAKVYLHPRGEQTRTLTGEVKIGDNVGQGELIVTVEDP